MKKYIRLADYRCEDGADVTIKDGIAKITFTQGEWPEVKFNWEGDLKGYNCLKFTIKVTGLSTVTTIFYTEKSRAICDIAREINHREFPNNCWKEVTWYFREQPGWITPPSPNPFDFDNATAFGLCVNGKDVTEECSVEIKDLYFTEEKRSESKEKEEKEKFKKFLSSHISGTLTDKKVLLWANSEKTRSSSIESVIEEFETYKKYTGVNGLIMKMDDRSSPIFSDTFFTPDELSTEIIDKAVDLYKNTEWGNFTDNFFIFNITGMAAKRFMVDGKPQSLDWFDDDLFYNHIYPKITYFCNALKSINANICFDNEAYTTEPYDYYFKYRNTDKTFAEYEEKVCQRGKEFAEVVSSAYPNAKVLMLYGPWAVGKLSREEARYGLLPAFYDGICKAKTNVTFIDGYEGGYEFTSYESVLKGLYICNKCSADSKYPTEYKKNVKIDFGIWVRPDVMSEENFAELLVNSLKECNEYVWIYTEDSPVEKVEVESYVNNACALVGEIRKKKND